MQSMVLEPSLFRGAVSLERKEGGVKPWRIPYDLFELFPPNGIGGTAEVTAGVRVTFASDTTNVALELAPSSIPVEVDLVIEDELIATRRLEPGQTAVSFGELPGRDKTIEIYLPQKAPTIVRSLGIDDGAAWRVPESRALRWIAYGSSITQCGGAFSPARTWPALVARRFGLDLTCFGFSGNCHLEPMVARQIRDRDADLISMCVGINVYGGSSLGKRTFRAAVIGFVQIVREKHPDTPIALMSPIWSPPRETTPNAVEFTLTEMRKEIEEAVAAMSALGDTRLHYVDGMTIFDESYAEHLPDELHPDGTGYTIMGTNYGDKVMQPLLERYGLRQQAGSR
ncbi:SGNH/GDSL hydrolase family protein [Paenibacillus flagellatus]|uniref:GDSL family lipase n=1 Tax=Paenibacillus flagellatus TaxID=2211139 RepID=A0A2V5KWZ8_9BACL|nr:SGNH/GDSL hydrolase family protein [Paenibacillus flagellatus]PYI54246.1 GDSL family lipase [Paenibacillus flagellatus]